MFRLVKYSLLLIALPTLVAAQQVAEPLAPLVPALPLEHAPQPTVADITAGDLTTRLYIFAADSMRGRLVGRLGNSMGTTYIAAEVKRMGLQPAGENGTYFQELPGYSPVLIETQASVKVGGNALNLTRDYIPIGTHGLDHTTMKVIYGGPLSVPGISAADAAGKFVVFSTSASAGIDATFKIPEVAAGAAAIGVITLDNMDPQTRIRTTTGNFPMQTELSKPVVLLSAAAAQELFGKSITSVSTGAVGSDVSATFAFISSARNVVAIIPGSDPVLRNQYVALGAHNDHIGRELTAVGDHDSLRVLLHYASTRGAESNGVNVTPSPGMISQINAEIAKLRKLNPPRQDSISNGADDDGSGSVTLLEIAEHIAAMPVKPKRSMLFVWHTGEEAGMLGSAYFTQHPTVPIDSIVTQLNADMVGRGEASDLDIGGPSYLMLIGARNLSTELGRIVDTVNVTNKYNFKIDENDPAQYYYRSDHYMYAEHGIPIAFFTTGGHPDYHQVTDEPQYIHYDKMARITRFIDDVAVHVGNLDHRPVVDKKP